MEISEIMNWMLGVLTVIAGGGWFINWKANRRKSEAQATHEEADGWKAMQDLYQQTIEDMRVERGVLKTENNEMREKYKQLEDEILKLKRQLERQGRKLEALSPFLCSVVGCKNRRRDNLSVFTSDNSKEKNDDNNN